MVTKRICAMVIALTLFLSSIDTINVFKEFEVNASTIQSTEVEIDAGENHTLLLRKDGSVWAWGQGKYGELGNGSREDVQVPTMIQGLSGIIDIDTIENNCIALKNDGTVYTWGKITLSDGTEIINDTPQLVIGISDATSVAAGVNHYLVVKGDKTVVSWGNNANYQLGNNDNTDSMSIVVVEGLSNAIKVAAGLDFSIALAEDGYLHGWGEGGTYQFGNDSIIDQPVPYKLTNIPNVTDVSVGLTHVLALKTNGNLYCWGRSQEQALGNGSGYIQKIPYLLLSNVISIEAGSYNGFAITKYQSEPQKFWVWGRNDKYSLGDGSDYRQFTPDDINTVFSDEVIHIASGNSHTVAITASGIFYVWGDNSKGQYGDNTGFRHEPTINPNLSNIADISSGWNHSLAMDTSGKVYSWGVADSTLLGRSVTNNSGTRPTEVSGAPTATAVSAGGSHSLIRSEDGYLYSWGSNTNGQLGLSNNTSFGTPQKSGSLGSNTKLIAAGYDHSTATDTENLAYSCGEGQYGQVGDGGYTDRTYFVTMYYSRKPTQIDVGNGQGIMLYNDSAYIWGISVGESSYASICKSKLWVSEGVIDVASGDRHYLALKDDGSIWAWGDNDDGQLGDGLIVSRDAPEQVLGLPSNIIDIEGGGGSSYALDSDGTIWAWGRNADHQLGDGTSIERYSPVPISTPPGIVEISAGSNVVLARTADGDVYVWGTNIEGNLGLGYGQINKKPAIVSLSLPDISATITQSSVDTVTQEQITASWDISGNPEGVNYKLGVFDYNETLISETDWAIDQSITIDSLQPGTAYIVKVKLKYFSGTERDWEYIDTTSTLNWNLSLSSEGTTHNSTTLLINDENVNSTEYQISTGMKYVNQEGFLVDDAEWITVSNSKVNVVGLAEMTDYSFSIKSRDALGSLNEPEELHTVSTSRSTPELDVPEVTVNDGDDREIVVNISDSNSDKTVYQIIVGDKYVNAAGLLTDSPVWLMLPTPKSITVKNIEVNKSYGIKVRAQNNIGEVTYWTEPKYKTVYEEVPGTPSNFATTVVDDTITITWNEVTTGSVEEPKHNVNYELEVDGEVIDMKYGRTYVHEALKPNTTHAYRVRSYNEAGYSEWSSYSNATIKMRAPSVSDINIIAERVEDTMVTIAWKEDPNILSYTIDFNGIIVSDIKTNFYKMYGLTPDTSYTYKIMGQNTIAATSWTTEETVVTKHLATPVIELDSVNTRELIIQWEPVEGASQYYVALYKEEGTVNDITDSAVKVNVGSATKAVFGSDRIEPNQSYKVKIYADSTNGISEWSHYIVVSSLPIKPAKVDNPIAMALDSTIELFWGSVTQSEESTPIDVVGYDILIDSTTDEEGSISGGILVEDSLDTELVDETEVAAGYQSFTHDYVYPVTTHNYRIRANTVEVSGDWSDEVIVTTLSGIPLVPRGIRMDTVGNVTTITWEEMPGVTAYEIYVSSEQKIYTVTENEFINRDVPFGVEELYMIRATNDVGSGEWSGYIINNTMRLQSVYGEDVDLNLTASNILDFSPYTLHVYYNADVLTVRDLCGKTPTFETEAGTITLDKDVIEITEVSDGHITFKVEKEIELGYTWEGIINNIIFEGNISGGTTLDYTVFVDESITWEGK